MTVVAIDDHPDVAAPSWSPPSGTSRDVYRNGSKIATVQTTNYTHSLNQEAAGSYGYKVCAGVSVGSNTATVSF
jgi:hypothetical protein